MTGIQFLKLMVRDPRIGAVTRSSSYVVEEVARAVPNGTQSLVEYGAGDGVVTQALLRKLTTDGQCVVVEQNVAFIPHLRGMGDSRLTVIAGDVLEISRDFFRAGLRQPPEVVVSNVPCTLLPAQDRERLVQQTHAGLAHGGRFVLYQYSLLMRPLLRKYFDEVRVRFEPWNFPPYFVMIASKK
ncbi:hypothetical protein HY632_03890 [Candidatus Uhrbacteria bacterium]|nr:hypothetical protein [Candidatus Uhrbacteria bacterium]